MSFKPLLELKEYSEEEIELAGKSSPAIARYWKLLKKGENANPNDEKTQLRLFRHGEWLKCALAVHFKNAHARDICAAWSLAAEKTLTLAWRLCGAESLPMALLALGKLGSGELNMSSDVDVIVVSRPPADAAILKAVRDFRGLLAEITEWGFCLRVDMDIRPGGRLGPHVSSLSQFEDYYWNQGATWERLALVRLRTILGPQDLRRDIEAIVRKFIYRKFLDFTLFEDLKHLRSMIRGHYESQEGRINLKYDRGGIRDIELFFHALQVLHGGKNSQLQTPSTEEAGQKIRSFSLLPAKDAEFLLDTYWLLRDLENHVQVIEDRQTYLWQESASSPLTAIELKKKMERVDALVSELLGGWDSSLPSIPLQLEEQQNWLRKLGFAEDTVTQTWSELIELTVLSKSSQRDEQARQQFLYLFVEELRKVKLDRDLGMGLLLDFVRSVRAKATFFTLLIHETRLVRDLAVLFSTSPYLAGILVSRPELIDSYLYRAQEGESQELDSLLEQLTERRLLTELIAANHFLNQRDILALTSSLTISADEICTSLLHRLKSLYGPSSIQILTLGKWGSRELGLRSDLDFVMICPDGQSPSEKDHKVARRMISRLTDQHKGGQIYNIDMRLRPTGNAGPILISEVRLKEYLAHEAAAWERQSYLRARPLMDRLSFSPAEVAVQRGLSAEDLKELREIRKQLIKSDEAESIDLKYTAGGIVEIEFAVQTALLQHKKAPRGPATLDMLEDLCQIDPAWRQAEQELKELWMSLRMMEQLFQLMSHASGTQLQAQSKGFQRLAQFLGNDSPQELLAKLRAQLARSREILKALDPIFTPS